MKKGRPYQASFNRGKSSFQASSLDQDVDNLISSIYGKDGQFIGESGKQNSSSEYSSYYDKLTKSQRILQAAPIHVNLKNTIKSEKESDVDRFRTMYNIPARQSFDAYLRKTQRQIPQITIPNRKGPLLPQVHHPRKDQQLKAHPVTVNTKTPRAANDNLGLFDHVEYDSPETLNAIQDMLKQGSIDAYSMYMNKDGEIEWLPCKVVAIEDNSYTIVWNDSGKSKVVNRLSVRFAFEDTKRFEVRREIAKKHRNDTVATIREQSLLMSRANKTRVIMEHKLLENVLKRLTPEEKKSPLMIEMTQELQNIYTLSHAALLLEEECKDPEVAKKYEEQGIRITKRKVEEFKLVPVLPKEKVDVIMLPNYDALMELNKFFGNLLSSNLVLESFVALKSPMQFSFFFEQIFENLVTKQKYCKSSLSQIVANCLVKMVISVDTPQADSLAVMVNLRFIECLTKLVSNLLNLIIPVIMNENISFSVVLMDDCKSYDTTPETFISVGTSYIEKYHSIFKDYPISRIRYDDDFSDDLNVWLPEIDEARDKCISGWKNLINNSFGMLQDSVEVMKKLTSVIPTDALEFCKNILPPDFEDVCVKHQRPTFSSTNIDLQKLRNVLNEVRTCYFQFIRDFKPTMIFGQLNVDMSGIYNLVKNNYDAFTKYVFSYLSAQTDKHVLDIGGMIDDLLQRTTFTPNDVEEWYDKHTLLMDLQMRISEIHATLDYLIVILDFMAEFLYEPENSYVVTYEIKRKLKNVADRIDEFLTNDATEKTMFIKLHNECKDQLKLELKKLQDDIGVFNTLDPNVNSAEHHKLVEESEARLKDLLEKSELYKSRDQKLSLDVTEYEEIKSISHDFDILHPIYNIAYALDTDVQGWLSTVFKRLDVPVITRILVEWDKTLKSRIDMLPQFAQIERHSQYCPTGSHPLIEPATQVKDRISFLILHLPIIKCICNPCLRSRHWKQISEVVGFEIGPNDGITWHWLMESNIEENIRQLSMISRCADFEYKIEKTLSEMIEELQNTSLHIEMTPHGIKLCEPAEALLLLSQHQERMQEVFIPPYIQPFIPKIKDYEVLAENLRHVLKESVKTESIINELKPAMDSLDLRTQYSELTEQFDNRLKRFEQFATSFKLSVTYHRILENQDMVGVCSDISSDFEEISNLLCGVLEQKRRVYPRFRLLNDTQLISIISNSHEPSKVNYIFSILYPGVREAIIENEERCTGIISKDDEILMFRTPVTIDPKCVEGWYVEFDNEISRSLRSLAKKLFFTPVGNVVKMAQSYPTQLLSLVFELTFTNNVHKCLSQFESSFVEKRTSVVMDYLKQIRDNLITDIRILSEAFIASGERSISNCITIMINHRDLILELLEEKVDSSFNPKWLSKLKIFVKNAEEFDLTCSIGPSSVEYGYEFSGLSSPLIHLKETACFFSSLLMCIAGNTMPLVCGTIHSRKTYIVQRFMAALGRCAFVYTCQSHSTVEKLKEFVQISRECNFFVILRDFYNLNHEVMNEFSLHLVNLKLDTPPDKLIGVLGTYTLTADNSTNDVPEYMRIAFRPVFMPEINLEFRYKVILESMCCTKDVDILAKKLSVLTEQYSCYLEEPLCSVFLFPTIVSLIRQRKFDTEDPIKDFHYRLVKYIHETLVTENIDDLLKIIKVEFNIDDVPFSYSSDALVFHEDEVLNSKIKELANSLSHRDGVIILGDSSVGKTALIRYLQSIKHSNVEFVNPLACDLHNLYGADKPGLLQNTIEMKPLDWIVFDGHCKYTWMETTALGLIGYRHMQFGDGTVLPMKKHLRFIYETTSIEEASPSIIAHSATVYVPETLMNIEYRLKFFVNSILEDDTLVEPVSQTIVSSKTSAQALVDRIKECVLEFLPSTFDFYKSLETGLQYPLGLVNSFFNLLRVLIYNFYIPVFNSELIRPTAQQLVENIPKFAYWTLYWTFCGSLVDDERLKLESFIDDLLKNSKLRDSVNLDKKISEVYFDYIDNSWREWNDILQKKIISYDWEVMTDREPRHLLFNEEATIPVVYVAQQLLCRGKHIMLNFHESVYSTIVTGIINQMPYMMDHFATVSFASDVRMNHSLLRSMMSNILPDTKSTKNSNLSLRIPLLSLHKFDTSHNNSAAELIRYIVEHDCIPSEHSTLKEATNGLLFVLCTDYNGASSRLSNHIFTIKVPELTRQDQINCISRTISFFWRLDEPEQLSNVFIDLVDNCSTSFKFSLNQIYAVFQRVAIVMLNNNEDQLANVISHQLVRVFYDATHSDDTISKLNVAMGEVGRILNQEYTSPVDIAGNTILTNFNSSSGYREVSNYNDLISKIKLHETMVTRSSKMKFTTDSSFGGSVDELSDVHNVLFIDILALCQTLSTPKMHLELFTEQPLLPSKLIDKVCAITNAVRVDKHYYQSLIDCFHNTFISAGCKKQHHILLVEYSALTTEEEKLITLLLRTSSIYGLFKRGELLEILTALYEDRGQNVDPFQEDTLENMQNYNQVVSDFITDCEMHFHICLVRARPVTPSDESPCSVYTPFFKPDNYIEEFAEIQFKTVKNFNSDTSLHIEHVLKFLRSIKSTELLNKFPYLVSSANFVHIIDSFAKRQNKRFEELHSRVSKRSDLNVLHDKLKEFVEKEYAKLKKMEGDLVTFTQEIEVSKGEIEIVQAQTEQEIAKVDSEAKELASEEARVDKMNREIVSELKRTNSLVEAATKELKNINSRDIAEIKAMKTPPRGVLLVSKGICVLLGQTLETESVSDEALQASWAIGRKVMFETNFISTMISAVRDLLSPQVVKVLGVVLNDPMFKPEIIASASSAAKSICKFIRASVDYNAAMTVHKERVREFEECQENLNAIRKKHENAMLDLTKAKNSLLQLQEHANTLEKNKTSTEKLLAKQRDRIKEYEKIESGINSYLKISAEQNKDLDDDIRKCDYKAFLQEVFLSTAGPFSSDERQVLVDEYVKICKDIGLKIEETFELEHLRETLLVEDEPDVAKWLRTKYSVSRQWMETTSIASLQNYRWIVAKDAKKLATVYLRRLLDRPIVLYMSAKAPDFEREFLNSISAQVAVILFDFDFQNPQVCVLLASRARDTEQPFVINDETITVPKDFFIIFAVDEIPLQYSLGLSVSLVDFAVTNDVCIERIGFKCFELADSENFSELVQTDNKLITALSNLNETKEQLDNLLLEENTSIFKSDKAQKKFWSCCLEMEQYTEEISSLRNKFDTLYGSLKYMFERATEVVQFFQPFSMSDSVWKMFEAGFTGSMGLRYDDVTSQIIHVMLPFVSAGLPLFDRYIAMSKSLNTSDQNQLLEYEDYAGVKLQSPLNILNLSKSIRPVLIHSKDAFKVKGFFETAANRMKLQLVPYREVKKNINAAMQTGTVLCTFCTKPHHLHHILSSINRVLGANFISNEFRFIIFALTPEHMDITFTNLFTKLDIINFDQPFSVKSVYATNIQSLPSSMKYHQIIPRLAMFDAMVSVRSHCLHGAHMNSFMNFPTSLQLLNIATPANEDDIGKYIVWYFYSSEMMVPSNNIIQLWDLSKNYDLPKSLNTDSIERSITNLPALDKPETFAESPNAFLYIDYINKKRHKFQPVPLEELPKPSQISRTLRNELNLAQRRIRSRNEPITTLLTFSVRQLAGSLDVINMGYLISPHIFIRNIRVEFSLEHNIPIEDLIIYLTPEPRDDGVKITGIVSSNMKPDGAKFVEHDGFFKIDVATIVIKKKTADDNYRLASLYHCGRKQEVFCVDFVGNTSRLDIITTVEQ